MKLSFGAAGRRLAVLPAVLAMAAGCMSISACSAPGTYPTVFAEPAQRPETTLSPDEIKQTTDSLTADRDHLCAAAIANAAPGGPPPNCSAQTASGATAKP